MPVILNFFGTGIEVLTVLRIYNAICVRTPYGLVHGYEECFGGAFWVYLHRPPEDLFENTGTHRYGGWLRYGCYASSLIISGETFTDNNGDVLYVRFRGHA